MKEKKIKKIIIFNFALSFCVFLFSSLFFNKTEAARLYFEPQEAIMGAEKDFSVGLKIDAKNQINAISVGIFIPPEITLIDAVIGNSIINFWVEKPNFDESSRLLTFSGIIPGGFQGEKEPLLTIKIKTAGQEEKAVLTFNKEKTKIYLHTSEGVEDSLELESLTLPIIKGKENITIKNDNDPPENFKPEISRDPNIFENRQFLVFAAQDKGSGVEYYKVKETRQKFFSAFSRWTTAETPYILRDQKMRSYVFVKAIDKAGNERITKILPENPLQWYENYENYIIIVMIFGIIWAIGKFYGKNEK